MGVEPHGKPSRSRLSGWVRFPLLLLDWLPGSRPRQNPVSSAAGYRRSVVGEVEAWRDRIIRYCTSLLRRRRATVLWVQIPLSPRGMAPVQGTMSTRTSHIEGRNPSLHRTAGL